MPTCGCGFRARNGNVMKFIGGGRGRNVSNADNAGRNEGVGEEESGKAEVRDERGVEKGP